MKTRNARLALMATTLALAACGGGGSGGGNGGGGGTSNTPPASAATSSDGFIAYLQGLVATQDDSALPVDVSGFVAPTTASDAPSPL